HGGGRSFRYSRSTRADNTGRFELVLPYSTEGPVAEDAVEPLGPYYIRIRKGSGQESVTQLHVTEAEIQAGTPIDLTIR
ncbi:MAG: hypothetical protein ACYTFT_15350, partial [Planctomycetota bacterium]